MERYVKCVMAVIVAAVCGMAWAAESPAAASKANAAELAKLLPDGAAVVVAGRSIDECIGGLSSFATSIEPQAGMMLNKQMLLKEFAVDTSGDGGGVDTAGAMGLALILKPGEEASTIIFVPLADVAAWRKGWGDSIKKDEGETVEYIEGMYGDRKYFTVQGNFAVFAEKSEEIGGWSKAISTPLSAGGRETFVKALAEMPLAVEVSMGAIKNAYPDMVTDLEGKMKDGFSSMPQSMGIQGEAFAKLLARLVKDCVDSVDGAVAGVNPTADSLSVMVQVRTAPDSVYSGIFAEQGMADLADLKLMPAGAAFLGAGGWKGEKGWQYVTELAVELVQAVAETPEKAAEMKEKVTSAIARMRESGLGESMAFAVVPGGEGKMFSTAGVYGAKDAAKGLDAMVSTVEEMKDVMTGNNFGGMKVAGIEITDGEVAGTPVKIITQKLDLSAAEPQQKQMLEAMYGDSITSYMAAKDGKLYFSQMDDGTLLADLMAGKGGVNMEKVARTMEKVGGEASGAAFISLPNYMVFVSNMMSSMSKAGGPAVFSVPDTSVYTAMSVTFSKEGAKGTLYLPVEEILAAKAVAQQMMSQNAGMGFEEEDLSTDSDLEEEVIIEEEPMESTDSSVTE